MNFFVKYKRLVILILFFLLCLLIGYLLYFTFFKSATTEAPIEKTDEQNKATLPRAQTGAGNVVSTPDKQNINSPADNENKIDDKAQGGITKVNSLTNNATLGSTVDKTAQSIKYYDKNNGKFYQINSNSEVTELSDKNFYNVESVIWAPDKNKAILEYPDGSNVVYNFQNKEQVTLPKHWKDFDFSVSGDQIVMKSIGIDENNRWLAVTNADGSKTKAIEALGDKDSTVYPSWSPNNQIVALYTEGVDFNRQEVFFVGLNKENFQSTIVEGRGFEHQWYPQGDKLLYSVYSSDNDMKPMLWTVGAQGNNIGQDRKSLGLETWAHKCTFSGTKDLYCAVPEKLESGAGLFPELAKNTQDVLYKIDTTTGLKKIIAIPADGYNMSNLIVSEDGSKLFFTDTNSEKIYDITLK